MLFAQHPLPHREYRHLQRLRLGVVALVAVRECKVAGGRERVWVLFAQHPLPRREHRHFQFLRLGVLALASVCVREVGGGSKPFSIAFVVGCHRGPPRTRQADLHSAREFLLARAAAPPALVAGGVGGNLYHALEVHHTAVAAAAAPTLEQLALRLQADRAAARVSTVAGVAPTCTVALGGAPTYTVVVLRSTNAAAVHAPPLAGRCGGGARGSTLAVHGTGWRTRFAAHVRLPGHSNLLVELHTRNANP